ncbi:MAG: hypothetical protein DRI46_11640 [Chloroflexi bacterium]|nr:MAG: hypothetical protein DRI46_11640 [Chloroflexota bacterium]
MKSTAINDRDWLTDVYRNHFNTNVIPDNISNNVFDVFSNSTIDRQQLFNYLMQNPNQNAQYGQFDRALSDVEKKQLMAENNLTANGGFAFNSNDRLQDNTFRNTMYNKGGEYLNDQQRLLNETEQKRVNDLAMITSDSRFDKLSSDFSRQLADQQTAFDDYQTNIAAEKEAVAAEKTAREKELQEQNNRNIVGRLNQQTNKTSDYMLYLQENNKPMYERIMQSLQISNPEMYQSIVDIVGAAG